MIRNNYSRSKRNVLKSKFIIIIGLIFILIIFIGFTSYGNQGIDYTTIKVRSGQTLWKIASKYNTDNTDLRKLIYQIKKINQLENVILQPGQEIKIPLEK